MTITHEEYLILNSVHRDGRREECQISQFGFIKKKGWIKRCEPFVFHGYEYEDEVHYWELSSQGRLEHNLYEKIHRYGDGCKLKPKGCPRCGSTDQNCPVCCGYRHDGR